MKHNLKTLIIAAALLCGGAGLAFAQAPTDQPAAAAPAADTAPAAPAAETPAAPAVVDTPTAPPAAAAAPADAGPVGAPAEGKGQVVFFRPSRMGGAALSFSVHEGTKGVGKLGNGSYFLLAVDPGVHEYSNQSEAKDTLRLEIEAGETYYVQQTIGMGIMMGRPHLTPSDKATFDAKHLKLSTKTASDVD